MKRDRHLRGDGHVSGHVSEGEKIMSYKTELLKSQDTFFHVYNRGVNKGNIFFSEENYLYFLKKLKKYRDQFQVIIVSYCLMPTHFHLLFKQLEPYAIAKFMGLSLNAYVKAINKQQKRTGHLFEGKYKMKLVAQDNYLIHLSRYMHLNPVLSNLASSPEDWIFSSYRDYIGLRSGKLPEPNIVLSYFDSVAAYKKFIHDFISDDLDEIRPFLDE
jgi:REP element-mobilizing transposase RayT